MVAFCQHSGLEFEARSKAARNHPAISELLTEANRRGVYGAVLDVLHEARDEGCRDLESFQILAGHAIEGRREQLQTERDRWAAIRSARRQRESDWVHGRVPGADHPDNTTNAEAFAASAANAPTFTLDERDDV